MRGNGGVACTLDERRTLLTQLVPGFDHAFLVSAIGPDGRTAGRALLSLNTQAPSRADASAAGPYRDRFAALAGDGAEVCLKDDDSSEAEPDADCATRAVAEGRAHYAYDVELANVESTTVRGYARDATGRTFLLSGATGQVGPNALTGHECLELLPGPAGSRCADWFGALNP